MAYSGSQHFPNPWLLLVLTVIQKLSVQSEQPLAGRLKTWLHSTVLSLVSIWSLTIAGSLKILPAIVSDYIETLFSDRAIVGDRQRLYGNTFQRSGDRQRSYASVIPAIRRSWAIIWKVGFRETVFQIWIIIRSALTKLIFNTNYNDYNCQRVFLQWES